MQQRTKGMVGVFTSCLPLAYYYVSVSEIRTLNLSLGHNFTTLFLRVYVMLCDKTDLTYQDIFIFPFRVDLS